MEDKVPIAEDTMHFGHRTPKIQIGLTWKSSSISLPFMVQECAMYAAKTVKQPTDLSHCGTCEVHNKWHGEISLACNSDIQTFSLTKAL